MSQIKIENNGNKGNRDINNNINNNSNIIKSGNKTNYFINMYNDEEKNKQKLTRPSLKKRVGRKIRIRGIILKNSYIRNKPELTTLVNVHEGDRYIADHINIDFTNQEFINSPSSIVEVYGEIYEYKSGDQTKYSIKILENPRYLNDMIMAPNYFRFNPKSFKYVANRLMGESRERKFEILDLFRKILNKYTSVDVGDDFIFNYIINSFMLNTLTHELHNKALSADITKLRDDLVLSIIDICASVIGFISIRQSDTHIHDLLWFIGAKCNMLQFVDSYEQSTKEFDNFVNILGIKKGKAWRIVKYRENNNIPLYTDECEKFNKGIDAVWYFVYETDFSLYEEFDFDKIEI